MGPGRAWGCRAVGSPRENPVRKENGQAALFSTVFQRIFKTEALDSKPTCSARSPGAGSHARRFLTRKMRGRRLHGPTHGQGERVLRSSPAPSTASGLVVSSRQGGSKARCQPTNFSGAPFFVLLSESQTFGVQEIGCTEPNENKNPKPIYKGNFCLRC